MRSFIFCRRSPANACCTPTRLASKNRRRAAARIVPSGTDRRRAASLRLAVLPEGWDPRRRGLPMKVQQGDSEAQWRPDGGLERATRRRHNPLRDRAGRGLQGRVCVCVCVCARVCVCACVLSCVQLCDPTICSPPGSSVHGILSRQEYWSELPFPFQGIFPTQGSSVPMSSGFIMNGSTHNINCAYSIQAQELAKENRRKKRRVLAFKRI